MGIRKSGGVGPAGQSCDLNTGFAAPLLHRARPVHCLPGTISKRVNAHGPKPKNGQKLDETQQHSVQIAPKYLQRTKFLGLAGFRGVPCLWPQLLGPLLSQAQKIYCVSIIGLLISLGLVRLKCASCSNPKTRGLGCWALLWCNELYPCILVLNQLIGSSSSRSKCKMLAAAQLFDHLRAAEHSAQYNHLPSYTWIKLIVCIFTIWMNLPWRYI